jgi:transcription initiation factor TFIIIB Brf1 subunit/transcription initiation factor TFIIB
MADQCRECGSTDLESDEQQGQIVCTGCGAVIKDYILLAQQQFQETSGGIAAVGQHVGEGELTCGFSSAVWCLSNRAR